MRIIPLLVILVRNCFEPILIIAEVSNSWFELIICLWQLTLPSRCKSRICGKSTYLIIKSCIGYILYRLYLVSTSLPLMPYFMH